MLFKKLTQKIIAGITAAALGLSLTFSAPAVVEAAGANTAVSIGAAILQASIARKQVKQQLSMLNDTEEGRTAYEQNLQKEYGVNTDYEINARMDKIMSNMTRAVGRVDPSIYDKPYKYFVSNDKTLNAACGVGHVMMVNIGTFDYINSDDEIAAIIGHEMGHGQSDHSIKNVEKNLNKQMIANVAVAAAGGSSLASIAGAIGLNNAVAHGVKKNESQADELAWEYILRSDYNIGSCAAAMQKLAEVYGEKNKSSFLNPSNHPDTDKRRDNYANKLYEYSGKHVSAKNGVITINGKTFTTVAATDSMSSAERSYFVLGNLAKAYHNGKTSSAATVLNGTIYLDNLEIITPAYGDEDAYILAERLNELINTPVSKNDKKSDKKSAKDKKSNSKKAA